MCVHRLLSTRYLFPRGRLGLGFLTLVVLFGIAASVASIIFLQALLSGLEINVRNKLLQIAPALVLRPQREELLSGALPPVLPSNTSLELFPYLESEVLAQIDFSETLQQGAKLLGITPENKKVIEKIQVDFFRDFNWNHLVASEEEFPGAVVSVSMLERLSSQEIDLFYPLGDVDPSGEIRPRTRRFRVIGAIYSDFQSYLPLILVNLEEARRLIPVQELGTTWGAWISNIEEAKKLENTFSENRIDGFRVESWANQNKALFSLLKLQGLGAHLLFGLMILLSSFNLLSLLMGFITEREKEIALLRVLGANQGDLRQVFMRMGVWLGIVGSFIGVVLAILVVQYFSRHPIFLPGSQAGETLLLKINWMNTLFAVLIAVLASMMMVLYPIKKIHHFRIAESLRSE